jgi:hypothetical protein
MSGSASRPAGSAVDAEIAHARTLLRETIRAYARAHSRRLGEVAYAVVTTPDAVPDLLRR